MKRMICLIPVLLIVACATANETAVECDPAKRNFSVEYPAEWKQLNTKEVFIITREDPFSQYILFRQRHLTDPFPHTRRGFSRNMPPLEAAAVVIDEMKSDPSVLNLEVTETAPALVSSYPGFKLVFTYGISDGHRFKTIYYGLLQGDWFYSIRYNASPSAYSEKDVEDFGWVLKSFRCKG